MTTITFDELANGTSVTTQYQSLGVLVSGVTTFNGYFIGLPTPSNPNMVYSERGLMEFSFNHYISGPVQTVSAYVLGLNTNAGLFAFDANNNLLGQALLPGNMESATLSLTSSGNSIARLEVRGPGSSYFLDNLSFGTVAAVPEPETYAMLLVGLGIIGGIAQRRKQPAA
jgi:hypothetical protein